MQLKAMTNDDGGALWQTALGVLQGQMAAATFQTLLLGSVARAEENDTLIVEVRGDYAREWLVSRLQERVERTVMQVAGHPVTVRFVTGIERGLTQLVEPSPIEVPIVVPDYDVHEAGWFPISEYECRFWAAILGRVAWRVWEIVRRADKRKQKTAWTPTRRWTAPALAEMVPCGRQAILGVDRACGPVDPGACEVEPGIWRIHRSGAFDRLQELGMATVERQGEARHTVYWISVRVKLGLLRPELVGWLPARLQVQHDHWLEDHGFEPKNWRFV